MRASHVWFAQQGTKVTSHRDFLFSNNIKWFDYIRISVNLYKQMLDFLLSCGTQSFSRNETLLEISGDVLPTKQLTLRLLWMNWISAGVSRWCHRASLWRQRTCTSVLKTTLFLLQSWACPELCSRQALRVTEIGATVWLSLVFSEVTVFRKPSNHTCHRRTLIISAILGPMMGKDQFWEKTWGE